MPIAHPDVEPVIAFPRSECGTTTSTDLFIIIRNEDSVEHQIYLRIETGPNDGIEQYDIAPDSQRIVSILGLAPVEIELYTDHDCIASISFSGESPSTSIPEFTIRSRTIVVGGLHSPYSQSLSLPVASS